jgi:predicted transcriptional regulator
MKEDDDDIQDYVAASGWRKRQVNEVYEKIRNDTIEEVALEIERMKAFGPDTLGSFAVVIRGMKR